MTVALQVANAALRLGTWLRVSGSRRGPGFASALRTACYSTGFGGHIYQNGPAYRSGTFAAKS